MMNIRSLTSIVLFVVPISVLAAGTMAGADPDDVSSINSNSIGLFGLIAVIAMLLCMSLFAQYALPLAACLILGAIIGGVFGSTAGWIAAAAAAVWFVSNKIDA